MTKKDCVLIANVISFWRFKNRALMMSGIDEELVKLFAERLEYNNDRFDKDKFISACDGF
jgi:hypothetical protein